MSEFDMSNLEEDVVLQDIPIDFRGFFLAADPTISAGADPSSAADIIARASKAIVDPSMPGSFPLFFGTPSAVNIGGLYQTNIPTSSDVWFIHVGITVVPPWSYTTQGDWYINQDRSEKVKDLISKVLAAAGGISLLKCPRTAADVSSGSNNGIDTVKEARYECMDGDRSYSWPSLGPNYSRYAGVESSKFNDELCAYIAFPVGPIGPSVRTLSLVVEKITEAMKGEDDWSDDKTVNLDPGSEIAGGLFPPKTADNSCYGLHIIEDYHTQTVNSLEYPAKDYVGLPPHRSHGWLRYYFKKTCKFLIPGQFIGLTIKPETFHCWWYQRSSPLLYSGAFFETRFYTSGKVIKVLTKEEKKHNEVGNVYVVRIRGTDIHIQSSDFLDYAVDEDVCVIKLSGVSSVSSFAFPWLDMDDLDHLLESLGDDPAKGVYTLVKDYVIVPFTFYAEQAGASVPQPA